MTDMNCSVHVTSSCFMKFNTREKQLFSTQGPTLKQSDALSNSNNPCFLHIVHRLLHSYWCLLRALLLWLRSAKGLAEIFRTIYTKRGDSATKHIKKSALAQTRQRLQSLLWAIDGDVTWLNVKLRYRNKSATGPCNHPVYVAHIFTTYEIDFITMVLISGKAR
jgi:hypothetical protein